MTLAQIVRIRLAGIRLAATLLGAVFSLAAAADPLSDTFQPDAFRTMPGLKQRMPGLTDPLGRECPLPAGPLTLAAAVDIALCRNPTTRSAWAEAHFQAAALGESESAWLPTIGGTDSETREHGPHVDALGNPISSVQNTNDAALNLSWTLYDFGARTGRIRSARYLLDAAAGTATFTIQQTVFTVVQAFYGVVSADGLLEAAKLTEDTAAASLDIARALQAGGAATLGDVLEAETAYDQVVLAHVLAVQASQASHGQLAFVLGMPADTPLKLDAQPVPPDVPALTARITDLLTEAGRQRPDLAAARAQLDAAAADISVARAAGRPSIAVAGSRDRVLTTGIPTQNYSQIGVTLTVPIFTGFSVGYGVREAQGTYQVREANVEQVGLQVTLDVWNGYYALESANHQLQATATLIKTAEADLEVATGRYKAGVGVFIDLLTAQAALSAARQARITAELNWEVSRAQLALALGRLSGSDPLKHADILP